MSLRNVLIAAMVVYFGVNAAVGASLNPDLDQAQSRGHHHHHDHSHDHDHHDHDHHDHHRVRRAESDVGGPELTELDATDAPLAFLDLVEQAAVEVLEKVVEKVVEQVVEGESVFEAMGDVAAASLVKNAIDANEEPSAIEESSDDVSDAAEIIEDSVAPNAEVSLAEPVADESGATTDATVDDGASANETVAVDDSEATVEGSEDAEKAAAVDPALVPVPVDEAAPEAKSCGSHDSCEL